jgi:hypothetical protein
MHLLDVCYREWGQTARKGFIMQVMKENLTPQLFIEVQAALWLATRDVLEAFLLATSPSMPFLSRAQALALRSIFFILRDHFHGAGAGLPYARLDRAAARSLRLFQLFTAPTTVLRAQMEVLQSSGGAESFGGAGAEAGDVTLVHVVRLLRQRQGDPEAKTLLHEMVNSVEDNAAQVCLTCAKSSLIRYNS